MAVTAIEAIAQDRADRLTPEFEQQLSSALEIASPDEFITAVKPLRERASQELTQEAEQALQARVADAAKALLLTGGAAETASGQSLLALSNWSLEALSDAERDQVDAAIAARGSSSTLSELGEQLRVRELLAGTSYDAVEERRAAAASRLREIGLENLRDAELLSVFEHLEPWGRSADGFHIEWSGLLTAPRDGEYVLSVSPLNISTEFNGAHHHQTIVVSLNGQQIIRATPDDWAYESEPISLRAGQSAPLVMTLDYDYGDQHTRLAAGVLRWKGPGFSTQIVPSSAFSLPSGEPGVAMNASWNARFSGDGEEGRELHSSNIVPSIDKVFFDRVVSNDLELISEVAGPQLRRLVSEEFLAGLRVQDSPAAAEYDSHPCLGGWWMPETRLLESCTSADRKLALDALLGAPRVIEGATLSGLTEAYNLFRVGAEREAVDLLGVWMQVNADVTPALASSVREFFDSNRWAYRRLTISVVWEHPESFTWLKDGYLVAEDGSCCLPVAYTVAYGHLVQGQIEQWIDELDARLRDESLASELRVNWLIARAMAEEIRRCPPRRHYTGTESLVAGIGWLQEAMLVAEAPATIDRVRLELAARLAAVHDWDAAATEAGQHADATQLNKQLEELQANAVAQAEQQRSRARASHLAELERRRTQAADRGDSVAEQRYAEMVERFSEQRQ